MVKTVNRRAGRRSARSSEESVNENRDTGLAGDPPNASVASQETVNLLTERVHHEVIQRRSQPVDAVSSRKCADFGGKWGRTGHHIGWSAPCDGASAGLLRISGLEGSAESICAVDASTLLVMVDHLWEWALQRGGISEGDVLVAWFLPERYTADVAALSADVAPDDDWAFPLGAVVSVGMRMLDPDYSGRPFAYTDGPEGVDALHPIRCAIEESIGMFPGVFRGKMVSQWPRNSRRAQDWAWGNPLLCFHQLPQFT